MLLMLTDAETNNKVLVLFGEGGAVFAKSKLGWNGTYTEIYDANQEQIVAVTESTDKIYSMAKELSR